MKTKTLFLLTLMTILATAAALPAVAALPPAAPPPDAGPLLPTWFTGTARTKRVSVAYTFREPLVERGGEYDRVTIPGLESHGEPGAPVLPLETARILLPYGTEVAAIEVVPGPERALPGSYHIEPGQELIPAHAAPVETGPDPAIYGAAAPFPGRLYSVLSVQKLTGYTILLLRLYPVQYAPQSGKLTCYRRLTVNVTVAQALVGAAQPNTLRAVPGDADRVRRMVDNPQTLATYSDAAPARLEAPSASLVDAGDPHDYIIITSQALSSTFRTLADWKTSKGLAAAIFTTADIYANYSGYDDAEQVRNFIVDAYTAWAGTAHPLQYVVLGGDTEVIPIRLVHVTSSGYAADMPVDLYYGGLDGDWDADDDHKYGEPAGEGGTAGEEVDFFAEVYVGRLTVETSAEATNVISKTMAYEQNPSADYLDQALWLGRQLNDSPLTWGGDSKDRVSNLAPQYNVTTLYDRDGTYSTGQVIAAMNGGTHLVNFDGHGNSSCCPLNPTQVDALTNDDYFFFYNLGCNTAHFDQSSGEAVAEHYIYTAHGAFAYIGNNRYGWYSPGSTNGPGNQLDRLFFHYAINTANHNVGKALQLAKEDYYPGHRWSILTLSLLGDPETLLVTDLPTPVANVSAPQGGSTVKHSVNVVGTATAGYATSATFDHYLVEYGAGNNPSSWTRIGVTATVAVDDGTLATWDTTSLADGTYTLRLTVDDGNGKTGSARAIVTTDNFYVTAPTEGELVRGGDTLTITGSALGSDFQNYVLEYGRGSNPSSWNFIFSSTVPVTDGVLLAWDTSVISAADDYTIRLTRHGSAHSDSERVTIYVDPTWQAGWPQQTTYRLVAPSLAVGDLEGDGDLELVATEGRYGGYSVRVHAWHHDGRPVAGWPQWGYGGRLSAPALADLDRDGDLEVVVGAYDDKVYAWQYNGQPFPGWPQWTGGDVHASPAVADLDGDGQLEVVAGSLDGKVYVWHYDGTAAAGWPQQTGAKLYASPALGDIDGDGDIEIVAARQGAVYAWHSDGITVTGWPISVTAITSDVLASPALGDLDGDGHLEIVLAAGERVYAWHSSGTSVTGWPQALSGTVKSSPALGDLDGNAGLEIVVGSDQVYAWHGDGSVVTGWPVTVTQHTNSSPVLGDVTGDGNIEVLIGAGDTDEHLYAWESDGTPLAGWPHWVPAYDGSGDHFERLASPLLTDLDQDGDVEVVIGAEEHVIVVDLSATNSITTEWPTFQHDPWFTGWYTDSLPNLPPFVRDARADPWYVPPGGVVTITVRVSDEDGVASVVAEIESPDETVLVTLTLHDDGAHGDGSAGDGLYGITWTVPLTKQDYLVDLTASDALSHAHTHDNVTDFTTQDAPYVQFRSYTINSESVKADGQANPGEFVQGTLALENLGVVDTSAVTATLSSADEYLWWYNTQPITFGAISGGGSATSGAHDFFFDVSNACPHSHTIHFELDIEDSLGYEWNDSFAVTVVDSIGPEIYWGEAQPRYTVAGEPVTITAGVWDSSNISSVQAIVASPDTPVVTLTLYDDGAHGDYSAGDGTYGSAWITALTQTTYSVDFGAEDGLGNTSGHDDLTEFTTQAFNKTANLLLFADGGSWAKNDQILPYYTATLKSIGAPHDLWNSYWYGPPPLSTLQTYTSGAVIWAVPTGGYASNSTFQESMGSYLDAGGRLFVTGQNVGQYAGNTDFYKNYLHANYLQGNSGSMTLGGVLGDPIGDGLQITISGGDGANNQASPDEIAPLFPATTVFTYTGSSGAGGIRVDTGSYKVVYFSFGFEAISSAPDREVVMKRVLSWLGVEMLEPRVYLPLILRGKD